MKQSRKIFDKLQRKGCVKMFKKSMALCLIIVMLFQLSAFDQTFVCEASPASPPEITYYAQSTWGGGYPVVGESYLYLDVRGYNLSSLSTIEANLYDKLDENYNQVASSIESNYLGVNEYSEDVYVIKLEFEQDKTLESKEYYIEIIDDQNTDMLSGGIEYLFWPNSSWGGLVSSVSISEMADNLNTIYLEIEVESFKSGETKDAFTVELVQCDFNFGGEPLGDVSKVGSLMPETYVLDELRDGIYSLEGKFSILSSLNIEKPVYVKVVGPGKSGVTEIAYGDYYGISVLSSDSPSIKNLKISNAYCSMMHQDGESNSEELGIYYVGANESELNLSFDSTAISNASGIDVQLKNNDDILGEWLTNTSEIDLQENALYTVSGTVYGTVYNNSPNDTSDLEIYYDSARIGKGTVISTTVTGAVGISYEGNFSHGFNAYPLYKNDTIEVVVEDTLNMESYKFTGQLINEDDTSETIPLDITAKAIGNDITLSLNPEEDPLGTYLLDLKYDGEDIYQLNDNMGELEATYPILSFANQMIFEFTDENTSVLKSIENNSNTLYLTGKRFSSSKSYKAYFVKHIGSSLTAQPFELDATVSSSTRLTIAESVQEDLPRGWYTVYVKEDGENIKGLADVSLLSASESSSVVLPTAKINNDEEFTLTPEVTINIMSGSFTQMKIATSEEALNEVSWQDITSEIAYTLEGEFGVKTLYFQFKTSSGFEYILSDSIIYRGDFLEDMISYGILGTTADDTTTYLHKDGSYSFYIQAEDRALTGYIEFLNENDEIITTETLKRTSGSNLLHTYSKQIKITDTIAPAKKVKYYVMDTLYYTSKAEVIAVDIDEEAFISSYQSKFMSKLLDKQYILQGSELSFTMKGTPGFTGFVVVNYIDTAGNPQAFTASLNETATEGIYQGSTVLASDVGQIIKFIYTLENPNDSNNKTTTQEEKTMYVTSSVKFTSLANTDGDYNGKTLTIGSSFHRISKDIVIMDNQSIFTIDELQPALTYSYILWDDYKTYKAGNFTTKNGVTNEIDLDDAVQPAKVQINLNNLSDTERSEIKLFYNLPYYPYTRYTLPGEVISGFAVGDSFNYGLELNDTTVKKFKAIDALTREIDNKTMTIDVDVERIEMIDLTGTITDERITDRVLDKVNVNIKQYVINGVNNFTYITNAVTDENGQYSAEVYPDSQIEVSFSKLGYNTKHQNLTISQSYTLDKALELSTQKRLVVQPYARPLLMPGEGADDSQLLALDMYQIKTLTIESMDGERIYASFYRQNGCIDLAYIEGYENKDVKVKVSFFDQKVEEETYIVRLDAYMNGEVRPVAIPNGELSAEVVTSNGNAPYGYMLLYDNNGKQVAYVESPGAFSTKQMKIEAGNYLALFFKGFGLDRLKEYKTFDSFELLELNENIEYIKKNVTIVNGRTTDVGEIDVPEILESEKLGTSTTRITTKYIPNSSTGELRVLAQIFHEGLGEEKEFKYVTLKTNGTLKPDSIYLDGANYSGASTYVYSDGSNKSQNTMYFTIIPSSVEQTYLSLDLVYYENGSTHSETISIDNLNVPKVTLIAPEEVLMGSAAKEVLVRGVGEAGSKIEIYANDQLVGETTIPENRTGYQTVIELPNSSTPMVHLLYAKMITDDEEITTGYSVCEVIDPSVMAYTSNFEFRNGSNYRSFKVESPHESSYPLTLSYNPYLTSSISFRINNLLEKDLDYVAFVNTYDNEDNYFEATHVKDVDTEEYKYSEWEVETRIGMPGEFSVYYSLAEDTPLGAISGSKPIDFEKAIQNTEVNPTLIPTSILESNGRIVTQEGENLEIVVPVSDTGYLKLEGSFKENQFVEPSQLEAQGYIKINTLQGSYWTKESLEEIDGVTVFNKRIYFSPELTAIMKSEVSPILAKSVGSPLLAQLGQTDVPYAQSSVDKALSMADYTGYVYNVADFTAHSGGNASGFGIGSKMQVLGGAVFVAQALSGPTSKDHNTLYAAVAQIKDPMIRSRIGDDIRQYDKARRSSHTVSTILNGASYGAGFGGLVGKGLSYVISTGSMVYGQKTGVELDIWWDAIMRDIQNEINLQEFREKKRKKKPAKKDKIKKPKWKIDPSGYVFEAIDSNRIEGITAYALVGDIDSGDPFVIWDEAEEWDEINPDITDKDGKYGWDVPEGDWKVKFVGNDDYDTSYTQAMTVPPLHDQVNIGLLSKRVPDVLGVALDNAGLEIEFDSFMQFESIYDENAGINSISIYDSNNNLVPCDTVEMLIGTEDTVYKDDEDNVYQTDFIQSERFTKRVRFVVDDALYPGGFKEFEDDGVTPTTYRVVISNNAQSYSGVRMDAEYQENSLEVREKETIPAPIVSTFAGTYYSPKDIDFASPVEGGTLYYTADGTEPTTLSRIWDEAMNIDKTTTIKLLVSKVGYNDSEVVSYEYCIEEEPIDIVDAPTANINSGSYASSATVTLSTTTDSANIYYTLDGSIPTISSVLYTEPIKINESTTLRAVAMKDDYVNSSVVNYNYTITGSSSASGSSSGSGSSHANETPVKSISYSDTNKAIQIELGGALSNNENKYSLSSDELKQLLTTAKTKSADVIVLKVGNAVANINQRYQLPITFIKEASNYTKVIKIQSSNFELTINQLALRELSNAREENFEIVATMKNANQISISIEEDDKQIEFIEGNLEVAIPHSNQGLQWVFVENEGTTDRRILPYSYTSDGFIWGSVRSSTTLTLLNNMKSFEDINGDWYEEAVTFVTSRELFRGTGESSFSPNSPMTRGMLATVLFRLSKSEILAKPVRDKLLFKDVPQPAYYHDNINWAYELGIISGIGNGQFAPDSNITREQLAVMLYNYCKAHNMLISTQGSGERFSDAGSISNWAVEAVDYAVQTGVMRGKGNNVLDPKGNATRAEVATMLQNFIKIHNNVQ